MLPKPLKINRDVRILIADDHELTRDMVKSIVRSLGLWNLAVAENGAAAIRLIREGGIDLVICDWNMPGTTGLEVLQAVRADPKAAKIPFLMLTGEAYRKNVVEAAAAGVTAYISKPFTAAMLTEKIVLALGGEPPKD